MKLLVGTSCDCFVYDVDTRARVPVPRLSAGERDAYGITWSKTHVYIAWRFPCVVEEYDTRLNPTERALSPAPGGSFERPGITCAVHQVLHVGGAILVTDTGYNRICEHDAETLGHRGTLVPHASWDDGGAEACRHYNSLYAEPEKLWVMAHMHTQGPSLVYEYGWGGKLTGASLVGAKKAGHGGHNVFRLADGRLAVCDTMRARLVTVAEGEVVFEGEAGSILRGVCWAGEALIVGNSALVAERSRRPNGFGRLLVWRDGEVDHPPEMHELSAGPIHDVRCLDLPDPAHWPNQPLVC